SRWWEALGTWVRGAVPPGTSLATGPSGALPYASGLRTFDLAVRCSEVTAAGSAEAGHRLWGMDAAIAAGTDVIYPGRELLLVESEETVLPAADSHIADTPDRLGPYQAITIIHPPEYRLDF